MLPMTFLILGNDFKSLTQTARNLACNLQKMAQLADSEKAMMTKQTEVIAERERCIQELEERIDVLEAAEKSHSQLLCNMESKLLKSFDAVVTEKDGLVTKLEALTTANNRLETTLEMKEATIKELEVVKQNLSDRIGELNGLISDYEDMQHEERLSKQQISDQLAALQSENDKLKQENATYKAARTLFVESTETDVLAAEVSYTTTPTPRNSRAPNQGSSSKKRRMATVYI